MSKSLNQKPFIELSFAPEPKLVPKVREFTTFFYKEVLGDEDGLSSLAVATHELLENAVKNSTDGVTKLRVEYDPERSKVTIKTYNKPTPDNLQRLQENVEELRNAPDVEEHF